MTALVLVSHGGEIEIKSAFLIYTLNKYLKGTFRIYIAVPSGASNLPELSPISLSYYRQAEVQIYSFQNSVLEKKTDPERSELVSNKISALKHDFTEESIVFLDSDILLLRDTSIESLVPENNGVKLKPANRANVTGWQEIYREAGQSYPSERIRTGIDSQLLPPYFNAGVIGIHNSVRQSFSETWFRYYLWLVETEGLEYPEFHRDQVALSLTINKLDLQYSLLEENFNFPVRGKKLPDKKHLPNLVHYHRPFSLRLNTPLKKEFKYFLAEHREFRNLLGEYPDWRRSFGGNSITNLYYSFVERLKYKKYLISKRLSRNSHS